MWCGYQGRGRAGPICPLLQPGVSPTGTLADQVHVGYTSAEHASVRWCTRGGRGAGVSTGGAHHTVEDECIYGVYPGKARAGQGQGQCGNGVRTVPEQCQ